MPSPTTLSLFLAATLGLLLVPGSSVLYVVTRSVEQGRKAGFVSVLGIEAAALIHTAAAALGLSAILVSSALAFTIVKYIGAAYLIYLGIRTICKREMPLQSGETTQKSPVSIFFQGLVVNLTNPQTALFFFSFIPQFVDPAHGSATGQIFFFGGLFVAIAFCTDGAYALLSGTIAGWLKRSTAFRRVQKYVTGGIYIALGITAAFAGARKK